MKFPLIFLFIVTAFVSCEHKKDDFSDDSVFPDETVVDEDTYEEDLTFEFTEETFSIEENATKDITVCGDYVYVCGESSGKSFVIAFKQGKQIWKTVLDKHFLQSISALSCADDNIYAVGDRNKESSSPSTGFVILLDSKGETVWEKDLDNGVSVSIYAAITDSSGNVFVGGRVEGSFKDTESAGGKDGFVAKYLLNGGLVFITQFGTPSFDSVQGVAIGSDGGIFAAGHSAGDITTGTESESEKEMKSFIAKIKPDGQIYWKKRYDAANFWKIINSPSAGSFFVGGSFLNSERNTGLVYQMTLDGKIKSTYNFPSHKGSVVTGIATDEKNNVYITGYMESNFLSNGKIPPVKKEIPEGYNIFFGIFNSLNGEIRFGDILGSDKHDMNPKIAVDNDFVPYVSYYSLDSLDDSDGIAKITVFKRNK